MKKLRIAVLSSNLLRTPPEANFVPKGFSGAPEKIMYWITEEMVKKGHDVTLFASGDSSTSAKLIAVSNKASSLDEEIGAVNHVEMEHLLISKCYKMAKLGEFDLIHSIFDTRSAYYAGLVNVPTISTLHSPLEGIKKIVLSKLPDSQYYVSISNAQRKLLPELNYVSTIYHGIDLQTFAFSQSDSGGMIFVGRVIPSKGVAEAVSIANKLKKKLYILGDYGLEHEEYWKKSILPFIDNKIITHAGFLNPEELLKYYQEAKLFLFPIQWEEPFGLVMIESMASGTPVVAFARGSVPEVVKDGETGFIVNSTDEDKRGDFIIKKTGIEGLCEAVERIYAMPPDEYKKMRLACRKHVEENFTIEKMVEGYERVYEKVIGYNK